ncbi:MAG TPA: PVC-type heme-binding CxxCH protein, partial [Planctomycetota bacterium]|nr:PVC-type heme-binding CxxCH protein [Planctomycetota bacterium]
KDIDSALGICVLGNRVIVSRSPHVFIFTDEDGDDVADKKDILFSGIAGEQHDHGVHAFVVGPDGKLYFNMGDQGQRLRDAKGEPVVDRFGNRVETNGKPYRKGLALRLDPDTMEVEVLGHNFRNNYELAVDAFGTVWQSDNDDDGNRGVRINYVMQHGNFGYTDEMTGAGWGTPRIGMHPEIPSRHWYQNDPGVVPNFLQTGAGSPTGICVYEGTLLPEVFRGEVIHCEPGQNVVRAYPAKKSGAGYAGSIVDIVKATDRWFRPADVCVDVDGGLMIADWYDAGVGGHHMADNDPRQMRGRIYRVAPQRARRTIPAFDISTPESAARELVSPNHERRYLAMSALRSMGERAEPAVAKLWSDPNPRTRARALHFLARLPGRAKAWIERAVADENADLRVAAVRIALDVGDDVLALGRRLADDAAPEVRREVALSLFGVDSPESASLWAKLALAHDGKDRWYLEALGIGAAGKWDACFDAWLEKVGDPTSTPASRDIVWRSRATRTPELLARILLDPSTAKEERARTIRAFDFVPRGETREAALVELAASGDELVREEALKRLGGTDIAKRPELASVVARLVEKSRGTERYPRLVQTFALEADAEALLEVITEHPGTSGGALAARLLLDKGDEGRVRAVLQGEDVEDAVKLALALGNAQDARAVAILADLFSREETDPAILGQAVRSLARTRPGAERVLALATPEAFDEELLSIASLALSSSPFDDVRAKAIATLPAPPNRDAEPLPPLSDLVKRSGDPARGRQVFGLLCATCHKVGSEGHDFGPELSLIGD